MADNVLTHGARRQRVRCRCCGRVRGCPGCRRGRAGSGPPSLRAVLTPRPRTPAPRARSQISSALQHNNGAYQRRGCAACLRSHNHHDLTKLLLVFCFVKTKHPQKCTKQNSHLDNLACLKLPGTRVCSPKTDVSDCRVL